MDWIPITKMLPDEDYREKNPNMFASGETTESILFDCLVNFVDVNDGVVNDTEIVALLYNGRMGWMYRNWEKVPQESVNKITHWMNYPDRPSQKDCQEVFNKKNGL